MEVYISKQVDIWIYRPGGARLEPVFDVVAGTHQLNYHI